MLNRREKSRAIEKLHIPTSIPEPLEGEYFPGCTCRNPWRENAFTEGCFPCAVFSRPSVVCRL